MRTVDVTKDAQKVDSVCDSSNSVCLMQQSDRQANMYDVVFLLEKNCFWEDGGRVPALVEQLSCGCLEETHFPLHSQWLCTRGRGTL